MKNDKKALVIDATWVLVISSLIAKVLGTLYRIPFQDLVGNLGVYAYQQIYPIYGIGMTFALSGFPVYISRVIAEQNSFEAQKKFMYRSFIILMIFGIIVFSGLNLFAYQIADIMQDTQLAPIVSASSWMFLLVPIISVMRGVFQGNLDLYPTAKSQVYEQIVRVGVVLIAGVIFASSGDWNVYQMSSFAMIGGSLGMIVGILVMIVPWLRFKKFVTDNPTKNTDVLPSYSKMAKKLFYEGGVICLYATILIIFQFVDSFTIKKALVDSGIPNETAKVLKGIYDRGQPLSQIALVVSTAFSTTLIPKLVKHLKQHNYEKAKSDTRLVVHLTIMISTGIVASMIALMPFLNTMLFGDDSGSNVISVYSLGILIITLININMTILQSKNKYSTLTVALFAGLFIKTIINQPFVGLFGTMGASISNLIGYFVIFAIMIRKTPFNKAKMVYKHSYGWRLVGTTAVTFFTIFAFGKGMELLHLFGGRIDATIISLLGGVIAFFVFTIMAYLTKLLTAKEWEAFPMGKRLVALYTQIFKEVKYEN